MAYDKIAVVGVGPVGGILGAHLLRAGHDVSLIDIYTAHLDKMRADGLVIDGDAPLTAPVGETFLSLPEAAAAGKRFDLIYVCVKATVVERVAGDLNAVLAADGTAVSFQNGLDTEQGVLDAVGPERTLRGVVNYAGNLMQVGRIRQTFFNPPNHMGPAVADQSEASERARAVAELMTEAGLTTEPTGNVAFHVWEKAIRNAALMPVSALTGQNMAQVMGSERSLHLVERLLREEIDIARAVGIEFDQAFYDSTLEYYRRAGTHVPSMRADVVDGRQTEIAFLNHKIAEYGEKHGVPCPYNRALANLVLCIDELATGAAAG